MTVIVNWLRTHSAAFRHRYPVETFTKIGNRLAQYGDPS